MFFENLPNEIPLIAAQFLGTMIFAVLTQAGLAFLGIGSANTWSWGTMMYWAENAGALQLAAWWWFVPPGFCLAMLGAGLALLNFGIDEFGHNRPVRRRRWRRSSLSLRTQSNGLVRPPGDTVLDVKDLSVVYDTGSNALRAVNDVSLRLGVGTTVGIAGESGSGKSTLAHADRDATPSPGRDRERFGRLLPRQHRQQVRQRHRCGQAAGGGTSKVSMGRNCRCLPYALNVR